MRPLRGARLTFQQGWQAATRKKMAQFFGDTGWAYFLSSHHHMSAAKNRDWEEGSFPRRLGHFRHPSKPGRTTSPPPTPASSRLQAHMQGRFAMRGAWRGRDLCRGKTPASPRTLPAPQTSRQLCGTGCVPVVMGPPASQPSALQPAAGPPEEGQRVLRDRGAEPGAQGDRGLE